ncbi:GntR family transcriptional regulator [Actinokineospora terrae]|uniref:GntR family transcriptional regulator n=1 Tax=Actinokineospora terrae TaxID=155974 RepID=A0A1H9W433_9PSEU|nr:GntR family transcriptional regulator [Actinokineospora terrae]SES28457.1 GntR family transcriptional regulator [Actinokineospora terrae]
MPKIQEVLPKYLQIANHYRDQITRGDLKPGDKLPSERQIAEEWEVVRPTAEKALNSLEGQGLVERRQGSGTYVLTQKVAVRARERYARVRQFGKIYAPGWYAVIKSAELVAAPDHVAEALGVGVGDQVIRRARVTHNDADLPVEMSISWADGSLAEVAPNLLVAERIRMGSVGYVESVTGRTASHARDQFAARAATDEERETLGLSGTDAAVLAYRHTVYDQDDKPLEYAEAAYPPGAWAVDQVYLID